MIGLFCSSISEQILLNIIADHIGINLIVASSSVSVTSISNAQIMSNSPNRVLPSAEIFTDAFLSLIFHLRQNRITVITEPTDSYFFRVAEALYNKATASNAYRVGPFIQVHNGLTPKGVLHELEQLSSNIVRKH